MDILTSKKRNALGRICFPTASWSLPAANFGNNMLEPLDLPVTWDRTNPRNTRVNCSRIPLEPTHTFTELSIANVVHPATSRSMTTMSFSNALMSASMSSNSLGG